MSWDLTLGLLTVVEVRSAQGTVNKTTVTERTTEQQKTDSDGLTRRGGLAGQVRAGQGTIGLRTCDLSVEVV